MKTKLRTFAPKQILRKPIKKVVKKWLKYSVHMTKPWRKTCASLWKHTIITFSFRFYYKFFVYNVIQTSCFFFLEKSSRPLWAKWPTRFVVGAYWNPRISMSAARRVSTLIPQFLLYLCIEVSKTACNGTIVHILRLWWFQYCVATLEGAAAYGNHLMQFPAFLPHFDHSSVPVFQAAKYQPWWLP